LHNRSPIAYSAASRDVFNSQRNEVASPQLAIYSQVEHRVFPHLPLHLQQASNGSYVVQFKWALLTYIFALIPRGISRLEWHARSFKSQRTDAPFAPEVHSEFVPLYRKFAIQRQWRPPYCDMISMTAFQ
jgi:hypothetical protein